MGFFKSQIPEKYFQVNLKKGLVLLNILDIFPITYAPLKEKSRWVKGS